MWPFSPERGRRFALIVSPSVLDDTHKQTESMKKEFVGFVRDVERYEQIAASIVKGSGGELFKIYGLRATPERVESALKHLSGRENKQAGIDPIPQEIKMQDTDEVYVFFKCHGSSMAGAEEGGYRFVWPEMRYNTEYSKLHTTFETYYRNPAVLYKQNPMPYHYGIEEIHTGFKRISGKTTIASEAINWKKQIDEWIDKNETDVLVVYEWQPGEDVIIHVPTVPKLLNDRRIMYTPPQAEIRKHVTEYWNEDYWKGWNLGRKVDVKVYTRASSDRYKPVHKEFNVLNTVRFHRQEDGVHDEMICYKRVYDAGDKYYSWLPPPGTRLMSSGVALTPDLEGRRFFPSYMFPGCIVGGCTRMFFVIDACYSGGFRHAYEDIRKLEPKRDIALLSSSALDQLNWGDSFIAESVAATNGHVCNGIFTSMFKYDREKKKPVRVPSTYHDMCTVVYWNTMSTKSNGEEQGQNFSYNCLSGGIFDEGEEIPIGK